MLFLFGLWMFVYMFRVLPDVYNSLLFFSLNETCIRMRSQNFFLWNRQCERKFYLCELPSRNSAPLLRPLRSVKAFSLSSLFQPPWLDCSAYSDLMFRALGRVVLGMRIYCFGHGNLLFSRHVLRQRLAVITQCPILTVRAKYEGRRN